MKLWSAVKNLFTARAEPVEASLARRRMTVILLRRGPVANIKTAKVHCVGEVVLCTDLPFFAVSQSLKDGDFELIPIPVSAREGLRAQYGIVVHW